MNSIDKINLKHIVMAGLAAETIFELYAWLVSPVFFGKALEPANLLIGLSHKLGGISLSYELAFVFHFLIGSIGFATFTYIVQKVLRLPILVTGAISGIVLWFFAQGVLAPLLGREFMMGFGPYTQSSFIGHVGMTLIIASFYKYFQKKL